MFDAHFHVIDPRFPLVPNQGYLPEPFTVADYRVACRVLTAARSFRGPSRRSTRRTSSTRCRVWAPGFVGVAQVPPSISDAEVLALRDAGVRAFRLNLVRGGSLDGVELAWRLWELAGWHLEVYADASSLPVLDVPRLVLDHLGLGRTCCGSSSGALS